MKNIGWVFYRMSLNLVLSDLFLLMNWIWVLRKKKTEVKCPLSSYYISKFTLSAWLITDYINLDHLAAVVFSRFRHFLYPQLPHSTLNKQLTKDISYSREQKFHLLEVGRYLHKILEILYIGNVSLLSDKFLSSHIYYSGYLFYSLS